MQPEGTQDMGTANTTIATTATTNATAKPNIVLVHGGRADGGSLGKVIPTLTNAGHRVIAVQLPLHSTAEDIATVKRAVELVSDPTILVPVGEDTITIPTSMLLCLLLRFRLLLLVHNLLCTISPIFVAE